MKAIINEVKIVGVKEMLSDLKKEHFVVAEEYYIDDKYVDGVDLYTILTVKEGTVLGQKRNTWHLADNSDVNVLPLGITMAGSINRKLGGVVEFKKRLPRKEEPLSMPPISTMGLIVEAYDVNGKRVHPAFELEDLRKPVFLGKEGKITFDKPSMTEFNTPIGYIASRDTVILDLDNKVAKYNTPVNKN